MPSLELYVFPQVRIQQRGKPVEMPARLCAYSNRGEILSEGEEFYQEGGDSMSLANQVAIFTLKKLKKRDLGRENYSFRVNFKPPYDASIKDGFVNLSQGEISSEEKKNFLRALERGLVFMPYI
jgi:hypothetical protein